MLLNIIIIIVILTVLVDGSKISLNNVIKRGLSFGASILLTTIPIATIPAANAKVIGEIGTSGIVFKGYS